MAARSTLLFSAALLLAASVVRGEGIHGGTAPELRPQMPSERGTMPSFRGEMPSLRSADQFERWFTPFMPVPTFPNSWLPSRPSFADPGPASGRRQPAGGDHRGLRFAPLPSDLPLDNVGAEASEPPQAAPIYLELPDRAGGPRRLPGR